jgi:hypothetical protein
MHRIHVHANKPGNARSRYVDLGEYVGWVLERSRLYLTRAFQLFAASYRRRRHVGIAVGRSSLA